MTSVRTLLLPALLCVGCNDGGPITLGSGGSGGALDTSGGASADETGEPLDCSADPVSLWPDELPGAPAECLPYTSEEQFVPVRVRVTNGGDEPILLTAPSVCWGDWYVSVEDAAGNTWPRNPCEPSCDGAIVGECGCLAVCSMPPTVVMWPGATYQVEWPGAVGETTQMPDTCATDTCEGIVECKRAIAPAPGPMRISVGHGTAFTDCDDVECACEPNEDGWCETVMVPDAIERTQLEVEHPIECPTLEVTLP